MRSIVTLDDVKIVLRELTDWKDKLTTKAWDLHGLQIKNGGSATDPADFVVLSQIPTIVAQQASINTNIYTQVWTDSGAVSITDNIPAFVAGKGREGIPTQIWVFARQPPSSGPLTIQVMYGPIFDGMGHQIGDKAMLQTPLSLPQGQTVPAATSKFVSPMQKMAGLAYCYPVIQAAGSAGVVSIGMVVNGNA